LIEKDGAAWSAPVLAQNDWSTVKIALTDLKITRSIHIPSPYPGLWNYWRAIPVGRGQAGDHLHVENVERLQLSGDAVVESVRLHFVTAVPHTP